jgi:hypothetical protein
MVVSRAFVSTSLSFRVNRKAEGFLNSGVPDNCFIKSLKILVNRSSIYFLYTFLSYFVIVPVSYRSVSYFTRKTSAHDLHFSVRY